MNESTSKNESTPQVFKGQESRQSKLTTGNQSKSLTAQQLSIASH
jgi:hypothetical protein